MRKRLTKTLILLVASSWSMVIAEEVKENRTEASNEIQFRIGLCKEVSEVDDEGMRCIEIYSDRSLDTENLQPIAAVYDVIRAFKYDERFGVCADSGVENQVLVDIVGVIRAEKIVYSFSISPYPCL